MSRPVDRRSFLGIAAASTFASRFLFRAGAESEDLPAPDFARVKGLAAGIRPYRRESYRLEAEVLEGRHVVHNYGHGGGGLTVAWGCALEAVELLQRVASAPREVAVLGAGVLGLRTATVLLERGYRPVIHAARFSPDTTSDVAGGQWAASLISVGRSSEARTRFERIQRRSLEHYRSVLGAEYGVFIRDNYVERSRPASVLGVPRSILPPTRTLERLPFANVTSPGRVRETLLVEPPIYLPRLTAALKEADVPFVTTRFDAMEELLDLPQCEWINCLGAGAGALFDDDLLVPVRGQLVLLEPQDLPWLLSHRRGYVFPRSDAVVLGGTVERGITDPTPDPQSCDRILRQNRSFFEG